jgi:L-2-hydroxyglutarate oxidase LhgO
LESDYDVVDYRAGILGAMIARELSKLEVDSLIEKESFPGLGGPGQACLKFTFLISALPAR